jgi:AmmeMemoRadiSam system protein B
MSLDRPKLRALEAVPREVGGHLVVLIRDPRRISTQVASMPPGLAQFLFDVCDGTHTRAQIEEEFERRSGERLDFRDLFERLDAALFLESERFRARIEELTEAYRRDGARPVAEIRSYPEDLPSFLDGLYAELPREEPPETLRALAIPHLDLRYGGRTAARGLVGLDAAFEGDTVVVLGVGHSLGRLPYALTGLDFETPLGPVPLARGLFERVVAAAGSWVLDEELVHASEHSLEYAATLLRHALGEREFGILPVACGSFHGSVVDRRSPREDPLIDVFLEVLAEEAGDCLLLASVDLAHMGPFYGDPLPLAAGDLASIEEADRRMLDRLVARDAEGFFRSVAEEEDRRRVCGLSALYTTVSLLPPGPDGRLLAYEQPAFPEEGNTVTICGMAWT